MKITGVEAIYVRLPEVAEQCDSGQDALIVKVHTDAGITGLGEVDSAPLAAKQVIEGPYSHTTATGLKHLLIGEDPFQTEYLWHKMYQGNIYAGRRGIGIHAISGIDLALWDILGKVCGVPCSKLWGGPVRDHVRTYCHLGGGRMEDFGGGFHRRIRCYASSLFGRTPAETGAIARQLRDRGFNAVKFGWAPMGQDARQDIDLVRQARQGFGKDGDVMIDAGLVWDAKTAIQRARAFSEFDIFWLEEPLQPDDYEGYRKLSEATEVRIAAGEEESSRHTYLELMDRGKIDVVQVDLTRCGGFTEAMKIASLAADRGLPVANHGFTTYINVMAALHWLNSVPNSLIAEFVVQESTKLREFITRQKVRAVEGYLPIPDEPGLGIDLDDDQLHRFRAG